MLVFEILTFQKGVIGEICLGADFVRANLMVPGSILHGGGLQGWCPIGSHLKMT